MTERLDRIEEILAAVAVQQQANTAEIATLAQQQSEAQQDLRESISDVVAMIGDLAQHSEVSRQRHEETDQRFNNLLNDARADRQLNQDEHRAFRETFQTLLAQISRLWQRVTG